MTPDQKKALIRKMCEAHDAERSAQKGEPSPWTLAEAKSDETWISERETAMALALEVVIDQGRSQSRFWLTSTVP